MKILLFFPENPLKKDSGNKTRVVELLKYYRHKGFEVDFVSMHAADFNAEDMEQLKATGLIKNGFLMRRKPKKGNMLSYFFNFKIPSFFYSRSKTLNFVTYNLKKEFNVILKRYSYDYIIISYANWANLLDSKSDIKNAKTIVDTHDFATVQAKNNNNFSLGVFFGDEIEKLNRFDEVWAISEDEFFVFNQFSTSKVRLVPFVLPNNFHKIKTPVYDLIYVASDNIHNKNSAEWFFGNVYPLIDRNLKIAVIGKIGNAIDDYPNVEKITYVENLDDYYAQSKAALCPMLSGSGIKIKVIEALSYGLPIVTNTRGIDGLSNKTYNGCLVADDAKDFAANISKLMTDNDYLAEIGAQAKSFYSSHYDAAEIYKKWDSIYD